MNELPFWSKAILIAGMTLFLAGAAEPPKKSLPKFEDFSVAELFQGKNASLILTKQDKMYRTRLKNGAQQKPNFAGHYILTVWGCGASCRMGAAIDAKTGRVHWLPGTICCWDYSIEDDLAIGDPILFRKDSKLLLLSGLINESGINGTHYFRFDKGKFIHLLTVPQASPSTP
jgi:hypothetical protein